jgi:pyruvate formate lyase activating enzyme
MESEKLIHLSLALTSYPPPLETLLINGLSLSVNTRKANQMTSIVPKTESQNPDGWKNSDSRLVLSITRMTVHNGPGMRTLILFKGCPLRCVWCSTPESQKGEPEMGVFPARCIQCGDCVPACPINAIQLIDKIPVIDRGLCTVCGKCAAVCNARALEVLGHRMTVSQIVTEVKKDDTIFQYSHGGVTISGGEPLFDAGFALNLLKAFRTAEINTGVDTCGFIPWLELEPILPYADFFLWDIKHMDPKQHKKLTGVSNELILSNARAVSAKGVPLYIRIPLIPGMNDSEENIRATCEFVKTLASVVELGLEPLHHLGKARYDSLNRAYPIAGLALIPEDKIQKIKTLVESYGLKCRIEA